MSRPGVILGKNKDRSLLRKHPWVFSGAISEFIGTPEDGEVVNVYNHQKNLIATGMYGTGSIAVRVLEFGLLNPDHSFWTNRIQNALNVRKTFGLTGQENHNIFRLVHGEGDLLPGLIIDIYNDVAVVQAHHTGIHKFRNEITAALQSVMGDDLRAVYYKSSETLHGVNDHSDGYLFGESPGLPYKVAEYGRHFLVNWETGQKTGFFIDQRENRKLLASMSEGKKVLNTFSYSGGFSVYALHGGAALVHSVDSSVQALELCEQNVALLKEDSDRHRVVKADAIQFIKSLEEDYDIIVLDPPAFAKNHKAKHRAIQAYKRLNYHAISQIKPGGIIFTFSCSQAVDKVMFAGSVMAAAIESGRSVRILHQLHQPADHPVNIFHPESEYLKGLVIQVD